MSERRDSGWVGRRLAGVSGATYGAPGVRRGLCSVLSVLGALAFPGAAVAKPRSISLKLSKPGYTVVALDNSRPVTTLVGVGQAEHEDPGPALRDRGLCVR